MRRRLLTAVMALLVVMPATVASATPSAVPTTTPIKHLVVLMQGNHSFDNYFGTYPGADGIPKGVCQKVNLLVKTTKGCVTPFHISPTSAPVDLDHGPAVQKYQYDDGRMDGFVAAYRRLGQDGTGAMGHYDGRELPYYWNLAESFVLFDRFFASTRAGNRESYLYWVAGTAPSSPDGVLRDSAGYDALPTIFDRLAARGIPAKFYVENYNPRLAGPASGSRSRTSQLVKVPLLSMSRFRTDPALSGTVVDLSQYYRDLRDGTLPAVSYVVMTGSSENPPSRVDIGQEAVRKMTSALMRSSYWATSAFLLTYDGWGGWYDHVPPPRVDAHGYGFRVPALLASPYARRGFVDHTVLDYTAVPRFIEQNWSLAPLAQRDAASAGLASAFDFAAPPSQARIVGATRAAPLPDPAGPHASTAIYACYGLALVFAVGLMVWARVRRAQRPRGRATRVA